MDINVRDRQITVHISFNLIIIITFVIQFSRVESALFARTGIKIMKKSVSENGWKVPRALKPVTTSHKTWADGTLNSSKSVVLVGNSPTVNPQIYCNLIEETCACKK